MVEKLETEYDLDVEWLALEIHPETPKEGVKLSERFGKATLDNMLTNLNNAGLAYGIKFGDLEHMPNSHNSLEAAEFARAHGKLEEYHSLLMEACFRDLKDIGDLEVLSELGKSIGLDKDKLIAAVKNRDYETVLKNSSDAAHSMGIDSTPTFVINDKHALAGAQPIEEFRKILDSL